MKAVLFDMDGVLVASEALIMTAARDALAEGGIAAEFSDFKPFLGMGEEHFISALCERAGKRRLIPALTERMFVLYEEAADRLPVYPAAKQVIAAFAAEGRRMALVSSAAARKLRVSLRAAEIDPSVFSALLSGDDVTEKKPAPQPYLLAAQRLAEPPENCLVVEDALSGVRAAKAAGMLCVAVTTAFSDAELREAGADLVIDGLAALPAAVAAAEGTESRC